jgi:hypothetical protein
MPETCNCGAQLVEGALFCHKCGRPLREIPEPESTGAVPVMKIEPVYPAVNFRNPVAVRVALLMAVAATVVFFLPMLNWMAAGFFASVLYRRRTGYLVNLESGLRLGWITGVLMFVIILVMLTASFALINAAGGINALPQDVKNALGPQFQESMKVLQSVPSILQFLMMYFVSISLFSMAGAALGARMTRRDSDDPTS